MGECFYHFRAVFATKKESKKALKEFTAFLEENEKATDLEKEPDTGYERVKEYIRLIEGTWEDVQHYGDSCYKPTPGADDENELFFSSEVGHLGNWENLQTYFQKKFNPVRCNWVSEEDFEADYVPLYNWEEIVKAILNTRTDALPLLLGVHPDLNELISYKLSETRRKNAKSK